MANISSTTQLTEIKEKYDETQPENATKAGSRYNNIPNADGTTMIVTSFDFVLILTAQRRR